MPIFEPNYLDFGIYRADAERARRAVAHKNLQQKRFTLVFIISSMVFATILAVALNKGDFLLSVMLATFIASVPALILWWAVIQAWSFIWKLRNADVLKYYEKCREYDRAMGRHAEAQRVSREVSAPSRPPTNLSEEKLSSRDAQLVVEAYGRLLEHSGLKIGVGTSVVDEKRLPFEKNVIKAAILILLKQEAHSQFADALKTSYLLLANFQPNVGDKEIQCVDFGRDYTRVDTAMAEAVLTEINAWAPWGELFSREFESLKIDIASLNEGLPSFTQQAMYHR